MSYAPVHARASALLERKGAAVTFTRITRAYAPATDTSTATVSTVSGHAIRGRGNPQVYEALKLVESEAPTLIFAPATYDEVPEVGDTVTWGGTGYTVRNVQPIAPDGDNLLARVVVSR